MVFTIQAHDGVMAALAVLGTVVLFAAALAVLVRVLGRRLPEIEESVGTWLLCDAAAWRARQERRRELVGYQARLELAAESTPLEKL